MSSSSSELTSLAHLVGYAWYFREALTDVEALDTRVGAYAAVCNGVGLGSAEDINLRCFWRRGSRATLICALIERFYGKWRKG